MTVETKRIEGTINGEPYSVPAGCTCVSREAHVQGMAALALLGDLDRSPNGRHQGDAESQDPSGYSQGNPHLRPGTRIGTDIAGRPIVVPSWPDLQKPSAWIEKPETPEGSNKHGG